MPLPADWSDYDQRRASEIDRELTTAFRVLHANIQRSTQLVRRFIARGLSNRWPTLATDYVHRDPDASTRQEQADLNDLLTHIRFHLFNEGASSPLTPAQAKAIIDRYAGG